MSQNKFMHPRNIYRKPPSFKELAIQYPEFRKIAQQDLSGKISIDFKNPEALKALTCSLLQKDFGLQVDIPVNRLIPTLPLRLNYLLWLEDLLEAAGYKKEEYSSVKGIDIGTGASCIYPLLAAKKNGWHMIATEVDEGSISIAKQNVEKNNLQELITVVSVERAVLLKNVVENGKRYSFSMCNPPFFSSEDELDFVAKSRSQLRTPPHNAATGDVNELVAPGGEVAFICRMMEESRELGDAVRLYTTMVGHKSSLLELKMKLTALGVTNWAETRFCQGNTTRWGLSWTFEKNLNLNTSVQIASRKKSNTPMSYIVPEGVNGDEPYSVEGVTKKVLEILEGLMIKIKKKKDKKNIKIFDLIAPTNTWSHQRRKKRMLQSRSEGGGSEAAVGSENKELATEEVTEAENQKKRKNIDDEELSASEKRLKEDTDKVADDEKTSSATRVCCETRIKDSESANANCLSLSGGVADSEGREPSVSPSKPSERVPDAPVLEAVLVLRNVESAVCLEMLWQGGTGGRDAMHQVIQYLKNKLR